MGINLNLFVDELKELQESKFKSKAYSQENKVAIQNESGNKRKVLVLISIVGVFSIFIIGVILFLYYKKGVETIEQEITAGSLKENKVQSYEENLLPEPSIKIKKKNKKLVDLSKKVDKNRVVETNVEVEELETQDISKNITSKEDLKNTKELKEKVLENLTLREFILSENTTLTLFFKEFFNKLINKGLQRIIKSSPLSISVYTKNDIRDLLKDYSFTESYSNGIYFYDIFYPKIEQKNFQIYKRNVLGTKVKKLRRVFKKYNFSIYKNINLKINSRIRAKVFVIKNRRISKTKLQEFISKVSKEFSSLGFSNVVIWKNNDGSYSVTMLLNLYYKD